MASMQKQRNQSVDILRGIAMLLVVLGHTMTGCTLNSEQSFLFNIIWSLQMPLFFIISGYVTRYSRQVENGKAFGKFVLRRTVSYMLPFFVWTFVVRGFIFRQVWFFDIKQLVYNMDTGYWFLFSIYLITIIFGISEYISNKINKSKKQYTGIIITSVLFVIGAVGLLVIGLLMGLDFLCIKLTLYYMPFYLLGFLFGKLQDTLLGLKYYEKIKEILVSICVVGYLYILANYRLFELSEGLFDIAFRAFASILGCIAICSVVSKLSNSKNIICKALNWSGRYSLEIYLIHGLALNFLKLNPKPSFQSCIGLILTFGNYLITLIIVFAIIKLLSQNKILQKALFGKK